MKTLPLLLLGVGVVYLLRDNQNKIIKKVITDAEKEDSDKSEFGEQGYKIENCKLTIYNKKKALDYAFQLGVIGAEESKGDFNTKIFEQKLLGDCAETEKSAKILMSSKEKALFIFDLLKYLYSGLISGGIDMEQFTLDNLQKMKNVISSEFKYNVSDFKIEIIKLI